MAIVIDHRHGFCCLTCTDCGYTTMNPDAIMLGHDCEVNA